MAPKKKVEGPASSPSTIESYARVKDTPEWKGLFTILVLFLANCIKWNCLARAVGFLSKIIENMNKAYVPAEEIADPFPTDSVFLPSWPIFPYNDSAKKYFKPGTTDRLKSVTGILGNLGWSKNALMFWARKECFAGNDPIERRDWAADVGKVSHYLIEAYLKKNRPEVNRIPPYIFIQAKCCFAEFLKWEKESGVKWVASELSLIGTVGRSYELGGTIDAIGIIKDELVLVDFKTGSGVYADQICQVAAYRHLVQQGPYYNLNKVMILHIPKDEAKLTPVEISEEQLKIALADFECACALESRSEARKIAMRPVNAALGQKEY